MFHSYPSDTMGNRLRAARLIREMTQGDLSMALEISRAAISQWEAGITTPGIDTLARAAALLKVSPEWLAWGRVAPDFSVAPGSMPTELAQLPPGASILVPVEALSPRR